MQILLLILVSILTLTLSLMCLNEKNYLLSFMFFIIFSIICLLKIINYSKQEINNDINTRYEELISETTENLIIKTMAKNDKLTLKIIEVNGINTLILNVKTFNNLKHVFTCNTCLKQLQQDYVNAYNIKNLEIYWDKGNYKFNSNAVIQLSSISIN